jgi:hypothetical protein
MIIEVPRDVQKPIPTMIIEVPRDGVHSCMLYYYNSIFLFLWFSNSITCFSHTAGSS